MATCNACGVNKLRKARNGWYWCRRHGPVRLAKPEILNRDEALSEETLPNARSKEPNEERALETL